MIIIRKILKKNSNEGGQNLPASKTQHELRQVGGAVLAMDSPEAGQHSGNSASDPGSSEDLVIAQLRQPEKIKMIPSPSTKMNTKWI